MSRILYVLDSAIAWKSGIWYHRIEVPSRGLSKRGNGVKQVAIGTTMPDEFMEYPSTVVFGRIYPEAAHPVELMKAYKKQGTRVLYDLDDDIWAVDPSNPSKNVSNVFKDQYEGLIKECDAVTTPSPIIAKKIQKLCKGKKVYICPNAIDFNDYKERPHEHDQLIIGYMGAASHWKDLTLIVDVLEKLYEKYDFTFVLQGVTGGDFESEMLSCQKLLQQNLQPEQNDYFRDALSFYDKLKKIKMYHLPFFLPEINPMKLSMADFDIGIAPLEDNEFNHGKSNLKFYEYAAVGTPCLASDVEPYRQECTYLAKNTFKDWYNKLEKLIVDKDFREKLATDQQNWVKENRSIEKVAIDWEMAIQKPSAKGAPKVLNQNKGWLNKFKKR